MRVRRVAIVGGGITGLAAAHRLMELAPNVEVSLFEAGSQLGGILQTDARDGFLLDLSADSFITSNPWAVDLCKRLGFAEELIPTSTGQRQAFVVHRGRLEKVPEGFVLMAPRRLRPLLLSPILSPWGKARLLADYIVPRGKPDGDESLASFARRRLGKEAYERLVQPLVGGIYTADAEKLSLAATLPRFLEMERRHGGLIRGARREAVNANAASDGSAARYSMFLAPRGGMATLVTAIQSRLPPGVVHLKSPIQRIARANSGEWQVTVGIDGNRDSSGSIEHRVDALIIAAASHQAGRLLGDLDPSLAANLLRIPYADSAVALVAYRREQIGHPLNGFGFVVPEIERRQVLACSFSSVKFPGRAPANGVLLRVFLGGAKHPEQVDRSDDDLQNIVTRELADLLQISGDPLLFQVARWRAAMPQYHVGHQALVAEIERAAARHPHLYLVGNAYHGVGIPDCIHSGEMAAEQIAAAAE